MGFIEHRYGHLFTFATFYKLVVTHCSQYKIEFSPLENIQSKFSGQEFRSIVL